MKTIIMLSKDNFFADINGEVNFGCKEDKRWVSNQIKDKIVLVGYKTYISIKKYPKLCSQPSKWIIYDKQTVNIDTSDIDINFGGLKTIQRFPSKILEVHRMETNIGVGLKFPMEIFNDYELIKKEWNLTYTKELWALK